LTKKQRKTRLWQFDPSVFQPGPKAGFLEHHIHRRARALGKYTLYSLAFTYPVSLVSLGIIFGGLVFWSTFAGSAFLIWLIIKKAGYAKNFADWGVSNNRFLGLFGAFGIVIGFFYGLIYVREWFFPIFGGALVIALILGVRRFSEK
jgi:hypothetical protein